MPEIIQSQNKRIRDSAPHRRSMSLTDEDIQRLSYLEKLFSERFPQEVPFSFSKTVSKAVELSYRIVLDPRLQLYLGDGFNQEITSVHDEILDKENIDKKSTNSFNYKGSPEILKQESIKKDLKSISEEVKINSESENKLLSRHGKPKKYQKTKRGY